MHLQVPGSCGGPPCLFEHSVEDGSDNDLADPDWFAVGLLFLAKYSILDLTARYCSLLAQHKIANSTA